jgi:hypothetical protein
MDGFQQVASGQGGRQKSGLGGGIRPGGRFGVFALLLEVQNMGLSCGSMESTAHLDYLYDFRSLEAVWGGIVGFEDCRFDAVGRAIGDGLPHGDSAGTSVFDREAELNILQIGVAVFLAADQSDSGETMAP